MQTLSGALTAGYACWNSVTSSASLLPPPSRSSSSSSMKAALSFLEANWVASSPRTALSRERKSSPAGELTSKLESPLVSFWATVVLEDLGRDYHTECLPPESNSSSEGNLSAIV